MLLDYVQCASRPDSIDFVARHDLMMPVAGATRQPMQVQPDTWIVDQLEAPACATTVKPLASSKSTSEMSGVRTSELVVMATPIDDAVNFCSMRSSKGPGR